MGTHPVLDWMGTGVTGQPDMERLLFEVVEQARFSRDLC